MSDEMSTPHATGISAIGQEADVVTSNIATKQPTLDDMLVSIEAALKEPRPIGTLMGSVVYLNGWDRTLSFAGMTCSVDHPYLDGTRIQAAALREMEDKPRGLSVAEPPCGAGVDNEDSP